MEDAPTGRFRSRDKLAKDFAFESPYIFAGDNPIFYVDKGGNKKTTFFEYVNEQTGSHFTIPVAQSPGLMSVGSTSYFSGIKTYDWYDYSVTVTYHVDKDGKATVNQSGPARGDDRHINTLFNLEGYAKEEAGENAVKDNRTIQGGWIGTSEDGPGENNKLEPNAGKGSVYVDYGRLLKTMGGLNGLSRENPSDAIGLLEDLNSAIELGKEMATDEGKKGVITVDGSGKTTKTEEKKFEKCSSCGQYRNVSSGEEMNPSDPKDTAGKGITPGNTKVESVDQYHK